MQGFYVPDITANGIFVCVALVYCIALSNNNSNRTRLSILSGISQNFR